MKLDAIDTALLDLLEQDGRMSNREVGRVLHISEGMVRLRLKKMTDAKAMRFGLVCDIEAVGMTASAVVRLTVHPEHVRSVAARLGQLDCCKFVGLTLGRFDVIVYLLATSRQEIASLVDTFIATLPGIKAVDAREPVGAAKIRHDLTHIA